MEVKIGKVALKTSCVVGFVGSYFKYVDKFKKMYFLDDNVYVDKKKLSVIEKKNLWKKLAFVPEKLENDYSFTVTEYMKYIIFTEFLKVKDYKKKIKDSLKIVGLSSSYLDRKISSLSSSEKKFVLLAISLLSNPDILFLENFFNDLDLKNTKKVIKLINQLIERYNKSVVICCDDIEFIYKYTKKIYIFSNNKLLISGDTDEVLENNCELLLNNNISVPKTVLFTNLVFSKKKVKLNYNKDIRDLIKDIYKKV